MKDARGNIIQEGSPTLRASTTVSRARHTACGTWETLTSTTQESQPARWDLFIDPNPAPDFHITSAAQQISKIGTQVLVPQSNNGVSLILLVLCSKLPRSKCTISDIGLARILTTSTSNHGTFISTSWVQPQALASSRSSAQSHSSANSSQAKR